MPAAAMGIASVGGAPPAAFSWQDIVSDFVYKGMEGDGRCVRASLMPTCPRARFSVFAAGMAASRMPRPAMPTMSCNSLCLHR